MKIFRSWQLFLLCLLVSPAALAVDVRFCTQLGAVDATIDERAAPRHAANFLRYLESGFYDGTVLHRVVPGSMIQGGSFDLSLQRRRASAPIANESDNGLLNRRGTIAAARSDDPDSASSQFFFNLADNRHLDPSPDMPGFTVFGRVTAGLELLDEIAALPTRRVGDLENVPVPLIEIRSVVTINSGLRFGLSIEPDPAMIAAEFNMARASGDAAGILSAIDALKRSCIALDGEQHLAEAEAAIAVGRIDRARYGLERFLATAGVLDPNRPRAERLFDELPLVSQSRSVDELIGHCRRPVAPSIPNGRFTDRSTMQAVESAVLRYEQLGELYLTCVTQLISRTELDESEFREVTKRHNTVVIEMTAVATRFNQAVRNFRSTQ